MIQLEHIGKTYAQGSFAMQDISLEIQAGEIFGVIGRSGAGKSTLVRCMNLLERPNQGHVRVHDQVLTALNATKLRKARQKIGMIFQHFNLLSSRTVFENVMFPLEIAGWNKVEAQQRVTELLELVGLDQHHQAYPDQLSGGQKQRVGIARALANRPDVLLCDEATSALDPETTVSILELLKQINQQFGLTIVLITHEMDVIKSICHRAAILEHGQLVEVASTVDIFSKPRTEATRSLTRAALHTELPPDIKAQMVPEAKAGYEPIVRLAFVGEQVKKPVINHLAETFDIDPSILHATSEWVNETPIGVTVCHIQGKSQQIEAALQSLSAQQIGMEVLGYVPADATTSA